MVTDSIFEIKMLLKALLIENYEIEYVHVFSPFS